MTQSIYKTLLDIYPYPIVISKYDGEFLFVNAVYAKNLGFESEVNKGTKVKLIFPLIKI